MAYREFATRLPDLVECTWEREPTGNELPVLPDGCVDLVWRNGDLIVAGPDTRAFESTRPHSDTVVGVRFRTGVAGGVLGLPASELRDTRVPLDELWGRELRERLGEAPGPGHRRRLLELAITARRPHIPDPDPLVLAAVRRLGRPRSRVTSLSRELGISERQLLRRFDAAVGYGPKMLDRVLRFQRFRSQAAKGGELARVAAELGYADQAHLTRECVRLSGLTPARLIPG
jgi:AraC-like DNA-binding protein